ncbi:hypothetical protein ColTof4_13919 [Colletotrichum tofieldiae]|nr:hypothetical protein ColTof4_13919 [Colletotrichum tofieldiae]
MLRSSARSMIPYAEKGLYKRFHDLATKFRDRYSFGVVWAKEPDVVSTLDCYNNLDEVQRSTQKVFESFNSLKSFFEICTARLVPEMTHENKGYFTEGKRNVLYHFDFHHDDRLRYSMNVRETAKKHINDLEFVTVDPVNFPEMLANLGLQWNFPAIALQDKNRGLTFPSKRNENITPDMVEDLIRSVTDGSARPAFQGPVNSATKDENTNADTRSEKMLSHDEL